MTLAIKTVEDILRQTGVEKPIYHSEADLQHALAMNLSRSLEGWSVRPEYRPLTDRREYTDIWLGNRNQGVAIELKYYTRKLRHEIGSERFDLLNQGAHDIRRYDFLKDITRLESVCIAGEVQMGIAILVTNDHLFWSPPADPKKHYFDEAFRLHDRRRVVGHLDWHPDTGGGTRKKRSAPLVFGGSYDLAWQEFSHIEGEKYGRFRFLAVDVAGKGMGKEG